MVAMDGERMGFISDEGKMPMILLTMLQFKLVNRSLQPVSLHDKTMVN